MKKGRRMIKECKDIDHRAYIVTNIVKVSPNSLAANMEKKKKRKYTVTQFFLLGKKKHTSFLY